MTWLLHLYPPRWRRRYGKEFVALIATERFSLVTVVDIIGGAIDAWMQPQSHLAAPAAAHSEGDRTMLAQQMRLRCAGYGEKATITDAVKGAGAIIGGAVLSVILAGWLQRQSFDPVYAKTLRSSGWLIAFVLAMPFTTLKGWPARTQAVFIGVLLTIVMSLMFGATWITGR
jgi:hypothetical protein